MTQKPTILIALFAVCFLPTAFAKKRVPRFWRPERILNSVSSTKTSNSGSDAMALQRVIQAENQRLEKDPYLLQAVFHSSPQVSRAAILALGRLGDPYSIETLSRILNGKNLSQKPLAAFSMGLIGDEIAVRILSQHLTMERNPLVRASIYRSLGYTRQLSALPILTKALEEESNRVIIQNIVEGLGILLSGESSSWNLFDETLKKLALFSQGSDDLSLFAAFALSQYKGPSEKIPDLLVLNALSKTSNPSTKTLLIRTLSKLPQPQVTTTLVSILSANNSTLLQIEAAKSLRGKNLSELQLTTFQKALSSDSSSLVISSLETLGDSSLFVKSNIEKIESLATHSNSSWVKSTALKTLCKLNSEAGKKQALEILKNSSSPLTPAALACLVILGTPEDLNRLEPFLKDGSPKNLSDAIETLATLKTDSFSDELKSSLKNLIPQRDPGLIALISELARQKNWKDFAKPLAEAYNFFKADDKTETKATIISTLALIGSDPELPVINLALKDNSKQVVLAALEANRAITGKEVSAPIPTNNKIADLVPQINLWKPNLNRRAVLRTNRGEIEIRFFEDAPITAFRFIELVQSKFYDGLIFHRVIPGFVAQGGDPRGDGFGGPGYLIRDEVSPKNHGRGTLGIATSGKDTGGSQFFFNLGPNLHLDGRYTVFGEVVSGLNVMDKLEIGDRIISARIK
jgi:cyclophilin family peptidyl-prolyl cis-trans isomerase/HEAT repeat protein